MKLKTSNKQSFLFLAILIMLTILLLAISNIGSNKTKKYVDTPDFEQVTPLNFIQLTFNEKSYNKLKEKKDKALSIGILETNDSDYVPVNVAFNGQDYKAEARLKGDWTDHLVGDKWSFRIKLKNDKTILGMRKFSIHHPKTRGYINEWLYHKAIKKEELIGLRYSFIEGSIHVKLDNSSKYINKSLGIYAIEETFDKRTIENNKRKESVILKFSENYWWNEVKKSIQVGEASGVGYGKFMKRVDYPVNVFSESKVLEDPTMQKYFEFSKTLLKGAREGEIAISDAFDVKKLALQNAVLNLFGGSHGNSIINIRFYYNPITSKLEPIAFDGNSGQKLREYEHFNFFNNGKIKDSVYDKELAYALNKVSKSDYLEELIKIYKEEMSRFESVLKDEFRFNGLSLDNIKQNQNVLKEELNNLINNNNILNINTLEENNPVTKIAIPEFLKWINNQSTSEKTKLSFKGESVFKISRNNTSTSSFNIVKNISVNYGKDYELSIVVKKEKNAFFGLRLQGSYPNRVDAVFDLEKGILKGVKKGGNFEKENASLKNLGNGWFKCILSGKIKASEINIIFGATNEKNKISSWEAKTDEKCSISIVPNSLIIKEIN